MPDEEGYGYVIILDNGRVIESKNVRMINEIQQYDYHLDFGEEPQSLDLEYIQEYPDIFDFDKTDDDILEVENIIEYISPKEVLEKDLEQDNETNTTNPDDNVASINESNEQPKNKIGVEKNDDHLDVGLKAVEVIGDIFEKADLVLRVNRRCQRAEKSNTDQKVKPLETNYH